jgi:hypothetical protein
MATTATQVTLDTPAASFGSHWAFPRGCTLGKAEKVRSQFLSLQR